MSLQSLNAKERQLIRRACNEAEVCVDGLIDAYLRMHDPDSLAKKAEWRQFIKELNELRRRLL